MKYRFFIFFMILLCIGCNKRRPVVLFEGYYALDSYLIMDGKVLKKSTITPKYSGINGFYINKDSIDYFPPKKYNNGKSISGFHYVLNDDTLMIKANNIDFSDRNIVISANKDSILLWEIMSQNILFNFKRINEYNYNSDNFDSIEIKFLGCFGNCPIETITANDIGIVTYLGSKNTEFNGRYSLEIKNFDLFRYFKYIDILNLKNQYKGSDDDWVTELYMFKNQKLIKKVQFSFKSAPYPLFNSMIAIKKEVFNIISIN
ncbi:MAG: hypothetical protein K1X55_09185 [Chitinophagales bacterium]|nr:hypothetical protein [Chitinophagales bacterium]